MRALSAAMALLLLNGAMSEGSDCTKEMCEIELKPELLLKYQVSVPADTTVDVCDGCTVSMEVIYDGEAWVSIGFSEDGQMVGSEAVAGSPSDGTVQKWNLLAKFGDEAMVPMPEEQQTLSEESIEFVDGKTIMKFTKIMKEGDEIEITTGGNTFLYAYGTGVEYGYHSARDSFERQLIPDPEATDPPVTEPPTPTPPDSSKDCTKEMCENQLSPDLLLRYQVNVPEGTTMDVCDGCTVTMETIYNGEAWLSIGFSLDGQMIGSEAVIGELEGSDVQKYSLISKSPVGTDAIELMEKQTLSDHSIEVVDGQTIMKFTKIMKEEGEIEITTGDNTFLWAHGSSGAIGIHTGRAPFELNLASGASEEVTVPNKSAWLAHGIMAFLAWGVFVPFAVQASLLRDLLPQGPLWYKLHRAFNATAFSFFIVIFAIGVAYTSKEGGTHFQNDHQKMGLAMFIMAFFQVAGGVFRPHVPEAGEEKSLIRKGWEVGHRVLGVALLACGFWQMIEGIELYAIKYSMSESADRAPHWRMSCRT